MSVKLAKLAVALLYAATVVVVLREFNSHGKHNKNEPPKRQLKAIQAELIPTPPKEVLKPPESRGAVFGGELRTKTVPFHPLLFGIIFIDTGTHDHPPHHKHPNVKRCGRKSDWKEWILENLNRIESCHSPPVNCIFGHRPIVQRTGGHQMLTS